MVLLQVAFLGADVVQEAAVVEIDVELSMTADELIDLLETKMIRETHQRWQFVVAKSDDGAWLDYEAVRTMTIAMVLQRVRSNQRLPFKGEMRLDGPRGVGPNSESPPHCIHLLVLTRRRNVSLLSRQLEMLLLTAVEKGFLPQQGEVPTLDACVNGECITTTSIRSELPWMWVLPPNKLYVRQELVMVWRVFKDHVHDRFDPVARSDAASADHKQQLVLVGSPGVGKTSVLLLMCLYIATTLGHRVVLFRKGDRHDATIYLLLGDDATFYAWGPLPLSDYGGTRPTAYDKFREVAAIVSCNLPARCRVWLCADQLFQQEAHERLPGIQLDLLVASDAVAAAPSGNTGSTISIITHCLVPLWSEADVKAASKKTGLCREACNQRYSNSGGNLRWFEKGQEYTADAVCTTVDRIATAMERDRSESSYRDAISMLTVADTNNLEAYTTQRCGDVESRHRWRRCCFLQDSTRTCDAPLALPGVFSCNCSYSCENGGDQANASQSLDQATRF